MKTLHYSIIIVFLLGLSFLSANHVYAPCIEGAQCGDLRPLPIDTRPFELFQEHFSSDRIPCKPGLYMAIKSDLEPLCLKAGTISKLASRGFLYGISANETQVNYTTVLIPPGSEDQSSNKTYSPDVTTVVLGINNTVRWTNQAESANSIAADMSFEQDVKKFGSDGIIKPGQSYEFTFTKPGTFSYHGQPHPWQMGKIIVLPNRSDMVIPTNTSVTNPIHYYDNSNLHLQVVLYDYFYNGIDKDGIVTINNQTFYQTTLGYDIYQLPKGIPIQFHNVTFSFPEGTLTTPGGAFVNLDVKFQDGTEEIYGGTKTNPDGSGMSGGISIPTEYGPHLATNSTTILGNHTLPQAGITIYNDKIKLLVSTRNQTIQIGQIIPSCVSKIPHQYALAGFRGDTLCPAMNFQASGNIVNYTGFYGVYGYAAYPSTSNFVLEPGHNGTITYQIAIGKTYSFDNNPPSNEVNITNDIEFTHDAGMHDHPGVDVSSNQQSEIIQKNSSAFINITFTASKDAKPGTYWVDLPPNFCAGGGVIILTITDCGK